MASRKRKVLSLKEKLDVLHAVDEQPAHKKADIAKDLGKPCAAGNNFDGSILREKTIETTRSLGSEWPSVSSTLYPEGKFGARVYTDAL
ncbi:hypothetical protein MRX96_013184 [Rhipicephalus microplus]